MPGPNDHLGRETKGTKGTVEILLTQDTQIYFKTFLGMKIS